MNDANSFLFPGVVANTSHIQTRPYDWHTASDEDHLAGMNTPMLSVNEQWARYIEKHRPHLVQQHLHQRKQMRNKF